LELGSLSGIEGRPVPFENLTVTGAEARVT
jgi:hypothetical protein